MQPTPPDAMLAAVNASPLLAQYGTEIDRESAYEILSAKMNAAAAAETKAEEDKLRAAADAKLAKQYEQEWKEASSKKAPAARKTTTRTPARRQSNPVADALSSRTGQTIVREVLRGIFSTLKKR